MRGACHLAGDDHHLLCRRRRRTDHALSDLAGRDCATWRIFKRRAICRDFTPEQVAQRRKNRSEIRYDDDRGYIATRLDGIDLDSGAVVAAKPKAKTPEIKVPEIKVEAPKVKRRPPVRRVVTPPAVKREDLPPAGKAGRELRARPAMRPATAPNARRVARVAQPAVIGSRYLVFGSFRRRADADRFAGRHAVLKPAVVAVWVGDRRYFRVVVRPDGRAALATAMQKLRGKGIQDAYTMRVCSPGRQSARCMRAARGGDGGRRRPGRSAPTGG
jgi:hypothetical protein